MAEWYDAGFSQLSNFDSNGGVVLSYQRTVFWREST